MVPFKIPAISSSCSPRRQRYRVRMIGIPPPTLASKKKFTCFSRAIRRSSVPWAATSALLEVTTCLPAKRQAFTKGYAGFKPPMVSTTRSTSGSPSMMLKSWICSSSTGLPERSLRSNTYLKESSCPAACLIASLFASKISATPDPMVPYPMIATFIMLAYSLLLRYLLPSALLLGVFIRTA